MSFRTSGPADGYLSKLKTERESKPLRKKRYGSLKWGNTFERLRSLNRPGSWKNRNGRTKP